MLLVSTLGAAATVAASGLVPGVEEGAQRLACNLRRIGNPEAACDVSPVEQALREGARSDVTFFGGTETRLAYLDGRTSTDITQVPLRIDEAESLGLQFAANEADEILRPGVARPELGTEQPKEKVRKPSPPKPASRSRPRLGRRPPHRFPPPRSSLPEIRRAEGVVEYDGTAGATELDNWLLGQGIQVVGDVAVPDANAWAAYPEDVIPPTAIVASRIHPADFRAGIHSYRVLTSRDLATGARRLDVIEFLREVERDDEIDRERTVIAFRFNDGSGDAYYDEYGNRLENRLLAHPVPPWSPVLEGVGAKLLDDDGNTIGEARGMLFDTGPGEALRAPRAGTVTYREDESLVEIVHGDDTESDDPEREPDRSVFTVGGFAARENARVERGALIGFTPTRDQSDDSRTTYQYIVDGKPVDPVVYYAGESLLGKNERSSFANAIDCYVS